MNELYTIIMKKGLNKNQNISEPVIWEKIYKNTSNLEVLGISIFEININYFIIGIFLLCVGMLGIISFFKSH
jgi:NADH:ubiquinone oxidoreductase subunit 6 (subunit J)